MVWGADLVICSFWVTTAFTSSSFISGGLSWTKGFLAGAGAGKSSSSVLDSALNLSSPAWGALTITLGVFPGNKAFEASTMKWFFVPSGPNCFNQLGFLIETITSSLAILTGKACCFKIARDGKLVIFSSNLTQSAFTPFAGAGFDIGTDWFKTSSSVVLIAGLEVAVVFCFDWGVESWITGLGGIVGLLTSCFITGDGGVL